MHCQDLGFGSFRRFKGHHVNACNKADKMLVGMASAPDHWHSMPMRSKTPNRLQEAAEIASRFNTGTDPDVVVPLGEGLINHTFLITTAGHRWVLQRVNTDVFPHPERILENLDRLSVHLAGKPKIGLRIPALLKSLDGQRWINGKDGGLWRLMEFIDGGRVLGSIDENQASEVGRTLGGFHRAVADLSPGALAFTLPGFHVTPRYVARLMQLIGECGANQVAELGESVAFVASRKLAADVLEQAHRAGYIPQRVIHGDPKLDNILFDPSGRQALALIDLDTVQPGLVHYDIGDCLRSCCNRDGESAAGCIGPTFDLSLCQNLLSAYAEHTRGLLNPKEIALIFDAIRLISFELGVRFLTDHLEGNRWFRVSKSGENLTKARIQFALTEDVERKESAIRAIIGACNW